MKVFKITLKNLKLLMRSKTSMLVVVFGPLLIMLLVGFAFNNNTSSKLTIGYYADQKTDLTNSFIKALTDNPNFIVINYPSDAQCIDMIQQGKVHLCVIFPDDFRIDNNKTNELQFYVDQSRANFVYSVIDTVSSKVDITSSQLSYQMTSDLITVIDSTKKSNAEQLARIVAIQTSVGDISTKLKGAQTKLNSVDYSGSSVDVAPIKTLSTKINNDIDELSSAANVAISDGKNTYNNAKTYMTDSNGTAILNSLNSELDQLQTSVNDTINSTNSDLGNLTARLDTLTADVDNLNKKLSDAQTASGDSSNDIADTIKALSEAKTNIDGLRSLIETSNAQINALKVTNANSIVNPIKTTIKPVSSKSSNLSFIFPYFIILIIVFIGIMLSSNLIIMEKTSKAYFRNFTTPTKDLTFVMSIFFTSFIVVLLQLVFILALAYYFLNTSVLSNLALTALLILAAISLFALIGMAIGYAFNSQESVTMASISVGSILLFLSNLILPLESMSPIIQGIARYNPYVLCSELLKKLTVFEAKFSEVYMDFIILGVYLIALFIIVMLIEKASKVQYISKKPITKQLAHRKDKPIEKYFKLRNGVLLMSDKDLLEELSSMTDKEFEQYVNKKHNDFEAWLDMNNKHDLAVKVSECQTRKEMLIALGGKDDKDPLASKDAEASEQPKNEKKRK